MLHTLQGASGCQCVCAPYISGTSLNSEDPGRLYKELANWRPSLCFQNHEVVLQPLRLFTDLFPGGPGLNSGGTSAELDQRRLAHQSRLTHCSIKPPSPSVLNEGAAEFVPLYLPLKLSLLGLMACIRRQEIMQQASPLTVRGCFTCASNA